MHEKSELFIDGFALAGYRSFGSELQLIGPFSKINLFVGANNSGKSNILRFLHKHYGELARSLGGRGRPKFQTLDRHIGGDQAGFKFGFARRKDHPSYESLIDQNSGEKDNLKMVLNSAPLSRMTPCTWFVYEASTLGEALKFSARFWEELKSEDIFAGKSNSQHRWEALWHALHPDKSRGNLNLWIQETIQRLNPASSEPPEVAFVPAIRKVGNEGRDSAAQPESIGNDGDRAEAQTDLSGIGIVHRLARLQNPPHDSQDDKKRFEGINELLREVTGNKSALLEIPYDRDMILVHMDGKTLPLESLGTGIHEVVVLAAAATVLKDQVMCIEEPELHLHPLLQRKLLRYLEGKTTNQYFISTHSAHLLDSPNAAIFRVRLENGATVVSAAITATEKSTICQDLGYRASDLVQSNVVIWVEGPSDRIYLNHWIQAENKDLIEGIDYSIMFYGGRLLSHLSANDPDVDDFISLRALNRNLVVVMDSDKTSLDEPINGTKQRVQSEFGHGNGFAWVTQGTEIENYVPEKIMQECVEAVRLGFGRRIKTGQFDKTLDVPEEKKVVSLDKLKIAKAVASRGACLEPLDLRDQIQKLAEFIRAANRK